jgi:hypothetical protein
MGIDICCGHSAQHYGVDIGCRAVATKAMVGTQTTDETDAPRRQASGDLGQGTGIQPMLRSEKFSTFTPHFVTQYNYGVHLLYNSSWTRSRTGNVLD